jgi:hypothetical protein
MDGQPAPIPNGEFALFIGLPDAWTRALILDGHAPGATAVLLFCRVLGKLTPTSEHGVRYRGHDGRSGQQSQNVRG